MAMTARTSARRALAAAARQRAGLTETSHRPWPVPDRPWVMGQTWERLLFAHWPMPVERLRRVVHPSLPVDTFEGRAWLAVTPFRVEGLRSRFAPPIPGLAGFPELNVRTYATIDGRPGIVFFSLDATNPAAVAAARRVYRLPYFRAEMAIASTAGEVRYRSERTQADGPPATFEGSYRPIGPPFQARPGTLEHWLTERYCAYTVDERGRVLRAEIHHPPWPLQEADAGLEENTMARALGLELEGAPLVHYANRQDVVFWLLEPA